MTLARVSRIAAEANNGLSRAVRLSECRSMNFLFRIFAVGALLTAAHTFAASAFEGRVSLTMSDNKAPATPSIMP